MTKAIFFAYAVLFVPVAICVAGGFRSTRTFLHNVTATTADVSSLYGTLEVVTSRDVASHYGSQWDIQRKGSHRIRQSSPRDGDLVRLRITVSEEAQLSELQQLEEQGILKIEKMHKEQHTSTSRELQDVMYDWKDFTCYRTVNEIYATMEHLKEQYPEFVNVTSVGESWWKTRGKGGNDIQVMVLTAPSNTADKANMMVIGGHHSREVLPPMVILGWAEHMLSNYGKDADITCILDRTNIHLIPLANPDGREIVQGHMDWFYRKNARSTGCYETKGNGVDLNRNYPMWYRHDETGSSEDPCDSTYHGSGPLSEPESNAIYNYIHNLFPQHTKRGTTAAEAEAKSTIACSEDSSGILLDIHSAGNLVYFPWGHEDVLSPNHHSLLTMASKLAHDGNYSLWGPGQDEFLYFVAGDATDASYGIDCVASFGFEIGSTWYATCDEFENIIVPTMTNNLLYAAKAAQAPYLTPLGPDVLNIRVVNTTGELEVTAKVSSRALIVDHAKFEEGTSQGQQIDSVKVFVDVHPYDADHAAESIPMSPLDGTFDQMNEGAIVTLDISRWVTGSRHTLYVQATDRKGHSGPVSALFYDA